MRWDDVRFDPGNNYDVVTGAYTAPYDGYYHFSISKRSSGTFSSFRTLVEGVSVHYCWDHANYPSTYATCTITLKLLAGQRVQIKNWGAATIESSQAQVDNAVNSWFVGHMLFPL